MKTFVIFRDIKIHAWKKMKGINIQRPLPFVTKPSRQNSNCKMTKSMIIRKNSLSGQHVLLYFMFFFFFKIIRKETSPALYTRKARTISNALLIDHAVNFLYKTLKIYFLVKEINTLMQFLLLLNFIMKRKIKS